MFGTIEITRNNTLNPTPPKSPKTTRAAKRSRAAPVLACTECRRRKTRCDGTHPCQRCRDSSKDAACVYPTPKPRIVPSQKTVEQLSNSLQQCRSILGLLFPSTDLSTLQSLSRKELVDMVLGASPPATDNRMALVHLMRSDGSLALEQLQDEPEEFDEDSPDCVADDVNALNLSSLRHSSYVGSS
ncbi:hypothetical protein BJ546DRAFT_43016 [Cryomyces antarcticus]